jgi:ABC-type multidrug transport system ATPase subunit
MAAEVIAVIADLAKSGQTMIVVTHAMGFARHVAHTVHVMHAGRVAESGPPDRVYKIAYASSTDGINWATYATPALRTGNSSAWDGGQIYRSTLLYDETSDLLRVWYSANDGSEWRQGYTERDYSDFLQALSGGATAPTATPVQSPTATPVRTAFPSTGVLDSFDRANGAIGAAWTGKWVDVSGGR